MEQTAARWRPIGAVLVEGGAITQPQLDAALAEQQRTGKRLGEILIDSDAITWLALANAIAEQARDLEQTPPVAAVRDEPPVTVLDEPPVTVLHEPPVTVPGDAPVTAPTPLPVQSLNGADPESRLQTVETMLKERQRAFLELVSTTESLRRTVARLKDELSARDAEIAKLRSQIQV